jgi:glucokinase
VVAMDGPRCQGNCPNRGCMEAVASGTALAREAREAAEREPDSELGRAAASGRDVTGALVTELAHDGDPLSRELLALIGRRLGAGVSSLVNIFNPEAVVVGGGVMGAGDLLLEPARAEVAWRALRPQRDLVQILPARFGGEAGMVGAAALAFDELPLT